MKILAAGKWIGSAAFATALMALTSMPVGAQTLAETAAVSAGVGELASQQVGSGPGNLALERARGLQGGGAPGAPAPGGAPGAPGAPAPSGGAMGQIAGMPMGPQITVITGTRVFDAITGQLLDDAIQKQVPQADSDKYFDDGTHGDLEAGDGEFTKVDERRDVLGQSNQRFKEQLVKALISADTYTPLQYFGLMIASTERQSTVPRNRAWSMVSAPGGGPGFTLREVPTGEPVTIPSYREKQKEKDSNIKNNWSQRFLQEFRVNKDDLTSQFYSLYIPQPPPMPSVAPPPTTIWTPFSDPQAIARAEQNQRQLEVQGPLARGGMGGGAAMMGGGGGGAE